MSRVRVCVLGNSHLASVYLAWKAMSEDNQNVEMDFFGAPKGSLRDLCIEDGCLVAPNKKLEKAILRTSGMDKVVLDNYDIFLFCGLGVKKHASYQVYRKYRLVEHKEKGKYLLSRPCFEQAILDRLFKTPANDLIEKVRSICPDTRCVMLPQPLPSEEIVSGTGSESELIEKLCDSRTLSDINDITSHVFSEYCESKNISFLPQPSATTSPDGLTKKEYTKDVKWIGTDDADVEGVSEKGKSKDYHHMNPDYGIEVIQVFVDKFGN